jgi:hypothetical protein
MKLRRNLFITIILLGAVSAIAGSIIYLSIEGEYSAWGFSVYNGTAETFSSVSVNYAERSFGLGRYSPGGGASATQPGNMPRAADIVIVSDDGATHRVHVEIPRPPSPNAQNPYRSSIPKVYFVIHNLEYVEATYRDPDPMDSFRPYASSDKGNLGKSTGATAPRQVSGP